MISRDEVIWLYRCFFGRDPENEGAIETHQRCETFESARIAFIRSAEFILKMRSVDRDDVYFRPTRHAVNVVRSERTLGLACILKNEERQVTRMLESCLPIVDFVSVVDTGSTDDTIEIARSVFQKHGVPFSIVAVPFEGFGHARNISLSQLPDAIDWSISIDADEHLVEDDYQRLIDLLESEHVDAWQLPRFNFVDRDKVSPVRPYPDYQRRLLRNRTNDRIHFVGAVHELVQNVRHWGYAPASEPGRDGAIGGPHIHHMGQVDLSLERWKEKHDFYTRLNGGVPA